MSKKVKRIIALVIILSLALTSIASAKPYGEIPYGQYKKLVKYSFDFKEASEYMNEKGIIKGYGNGDFGFDDNVKRGDIVVMISRAFNINKLVNKYADKFEDLDEDDYYYESIQAARALGIARGDGKKFGPKNHVTYEEAIAFVARTAAFYGYDANEIEDGLKELYKGELNEKAKRKEIANMLYYVLTGDEFKDDIDDEGDELNLKTIEFAMGEDDVLRFDDEIANDDNLIDMIEDKVDDELIYVIFKDVNNAKLYEEYDDIEIDEDEEYYVDPDDGKDLEDVTIVPMDDKDITIKYKAVYEDINKGHEGLIKITVDEDDITDLEDISISTKENTAKEFGIFNVLDTLNHNEEIEEIVFSLPDDGTLKYKNVEINDEDTFYLNDLPNITFTPEENFVNDTAVVLYKVETVNGSYTGKINIEVNYLIDTIKVDTTTDTAININLPEELEYLDEEYDINTIIFTAIPSSSDGKLYYVDSVGRVYLDFDDENDRFDIDELESLTFDPDEDFNGTEIKYTVIVDLDDDKVVKKEFSGLITIELD